MVCNLACTISIYLYIMIWCGRVTVVAPLNTYRLTHIWSWCIWRRNLKGLIRSITSVFRSQEKGFTGRSAGFRRHRGAGGSLGDTASEVLHIWAKTEITAMVNLNHWKWGFWSGDGELTLHVQTPHSLVCDLGRGRNISAANLRRKTTKLIGAIKKPLLQVLTRLIGVSGRWRRLQASPRGEQRVQTFWEKDNININASPSNIPGLSYPLPPGTVLKAAPICSEMLIPDCSACKSPQGFQAPAQIPDSSPTKRVLESQLLINQQAASVSRCNELRWGSGCLASLGEKMERGRKLFNHAWLAQAHWPITSAADTPGHIDLFIVF